MDARAFLTEFGHIAAAPGGVQRLRELVLCLATHGEISTGGLSVLGDARVLLKNAEAIKHRIVAAGKARREEALPNVLLADETKYPTSWVVTRLGDLVQLVSGQHLSPDQQNAHGKGTPYFTGASDFGLLHPIPTRWTTVGKAIAVRGDILIAVKGTIGKINALNLKEAALGRQLMAVRAIGISTKFLTLILRAHENYFLAKSVGIAIPGISREDILHVVVGVPSLDEQERIVAKVDELMALCDKLEAQQQVRETLAKTTRDTVFGKLAAARTRDEVHQAWARVETEALLLLDCPESINCYRAAILDLAVSGLLISPNDQADKTGTDLLEEIAGRRMDWIGEAQDQELKEALGMQKKLRTQRVEKPKAGLPAHWAWGSLLQVSQVVVDCHNKTAPYVPEGIHLIRTSDIRNGRMDLRNTRKISADTYAYWARRLPPRTGDVFFTREAPMGESAIVPEGETVCLGQRSMLIRLFPELFNNRFLLYAIYSPSFQARMMEAAIGMTVKHLRVGGVEDLMVPVPPKQEQDRIVAIVDALFAHCDRLMAQLASKQATASNLAKASVEAITGIRMEVQEEMKAPKTELVSRLSLGVSPADKDQAPLAALLMRSKGELAAKALWQASGLEIDEFYRQLNTEMAHGWIVQPEVAYVREVAAG